MSEPTPSHPHGYVDRRVSGTGHRRTPAGHVRSVAIVTSTGKSTYRVPNRDRKLIHPYTAAHDTSGDPIDHQPRARDPLSANQEHKTPPRPKPTRKHTIPPDTHPPARRGIHGQGSRVSGNTGEKLRSDNPHITSPHRHNTIPNSHTLPTTMSPHDIYASPSEMEEGGEADQEDEGIARLSRPEDDSDVESTAQAQAQANIRLKVRARDRLRSMYSSRSPPGSGEVVSRLSSSDVEELLRMLLNRLMPTAPQHVESREDEERQQPPSEHPPAPNRHTEPLVAEHRLPPAPSEQHLAASSVPGPPSSASAPISTPRKQSHKPPSSGRDDYDEISGDGYGFHDTSRRRWWQFWKKKPRT